MSRHHKNSHQQQGKIKDEFKLWIGQNEELVEASGLPSLVLSDKEHWHDFLEHGRLLHCDDDPSGFDVSQLSIRQKLSLIRLLRTWPGFLETEVAQGLMIDMLNAVDEFAPREYDK